MAQRGQSAGRRTGRQPPFDAAAGQPTTRPGGSVPDVASLERKIDNLTNLVLELNRRVQDLEAKQQPSPATSPSK
jgi:hypothetical protein